MRAIWITLLLLSLPAIAAAQQIAIAEYPLPTVCGGGTLCGPSGIAAGPDGALWFTEYYGNNIGRITTAGLITEYPLAAAGSLPWGITAGPDGALWFTEFNGNKIGRITTAGVITEYPVPTASSVPEGIAAGPDGALWFTESLGNKIGRITTAGVITEYPVPTPNGRPSGITAGPDGALWFTEYYVNKIGRITTAGVITEYRLPTPRSLPQGITAGPDGAPWFTEQGGKIGRITTAGVISEYRVPTPFSGPNEITAGPDGALWFTESSGNNIGRITTAGVVTEYPVPTAHPRPYPAGITAGPDGALWFTELYGNKIGEAVLVTADLSVSPASGVYRTNLAFTGSAFAPYESVQIYLRGVGSAVLASTMADASGSFTATARGPQSPNGPRLFLGVGQTSGKLGAANFTVKPRLILNPNSGAVASSTSAQGFGFGPLETVKIYWNNQQNFLGTATANVNGTFTGSAALTFTIPTRASLGVHKVLGVGQTTATVGVGPFTVQ